MPFTAKHKVFFSIDMDAFYCGVEQRNDPSLAGTAFAVCQKNIVASLSYPARDLGLQKLNKVMDIRRAHPQVKLINGETLAPYRRAGRELFDWMQSLIPNGGIERLGMEELKFEVTGIVEQICNELAKRQLLPGESKPMLDEIEIEEIMLPGFDSLFECPDLMFEFPGKTWPQNLGTYDCCPEKISVELYVAAFLAQHLLDRFKFEKGFDCSIGVATSKTLAKLATSINKPRGVGVVINGHEREYMAALPLDKVTGLGHRTFRMLIKELKLEQDRPTVADLLAKCHEQRQFVDVCTATLGLEASENLWKLLNGKEDAKIIAWQRPNQLSVEDTFLPFVPSKNCGLIIERLATELVDLCAVEMTTESLWQATPKLFRVGIAVDFNPRKTRSIRLTINQRQNMEQQLKEMRRILIQRGSQILIELAPREFRLVNLAIVFDAQ